MWTIPPGFPTQKVVRRPWVVFGSETGVREPLGVALIGCGTVGGGVARLLLEEASRLALRAGRPLILRRVIVRDPDKPRPVDIPRELLSTDLASVVNDPSIHMAVEVVGGVDFARQAVLQLLAAGKDVVTANKALLARCGREVFDTARAHGRAVAFEAAVAGGVPIISALTHGLAANQVTAIQGILNGTCNFILTSMTEHGRAYADALAEAQARGYAEADPTLDVDGTDATQKLAILAHIAFGISLPVESIERRGIQQIDPLDVAYARELGYVIKLLAECWLNEGQLALHVSPVLLRKTDPLAQVRGAYNAIHVVGDVVGDTLYYGRGAGSMPTASAIVADLLELAVARGQRVFQTQRFWSGQESQVRLRPPGTVRSRFYLRLLVEDRPGVLAEVAHALAQEQISIASVIQHEVPDEAEGQRVQMVIVTHSAAAGAFRRAVERINPLPFLSNPSVYYPVAD